MAEGLRAFINGHRGSDSSRDRKRDLYTLTSTRDSAKLRQRSLDLPLTLYITDRNKFLEFSLLISGHDAKEIHSLRLMRNT